jgi:hypothetical protein
MKLLETGHHNLGSMLAGAYFEYSTSDAEEIPGDCNILIKSSSSMIHRNFPTAMVQVKGRISHTSRNMMQIMNRKLLRKH